MGLEVDNSGYGFAALIDTIKESARGSRILSGCAVSQYPAGATSGVYVTSGTALISGIVNFISGETITNVSVANGAIGRDRYDLVYLTNTYNVSGTAMMKATVNYLSGAYAITPPWAAIPPNLPNNAVCLSLLKMDSGATTIGNANITDYRMFDAPKNGSQFARASQGTSTASSAVTLDTVRIKASDLSPGTSIRVIMESTSDSGSGSTVAKLQIRSGNGGLYTSADVHGATASSALNFFTVLRDTSSATQLRVFKIGRNAAGAVATLSDAANITSPLGEQDLYIDFVGNRGADGTLTWRWAVLMERGGAVDTLY